MMRVSIFFLASALAFSSSTLAQSIGIPIYNINRNKQWAIPVSVGTPAQDPGLHLLDTGSTVFWTLACPACLTEGDGRTSFDPKASSTFVPGNTTFDLSYLGGLTAKGPVASETITFRDSANSFITNSTVLAATDVTLLSALQPGLSGVFGLGEPSHTEFVFVEGAEIDYSPPWEKYILSKSLPPYVGFKLGLSSNNTTQITGEVTFGALDPVYNSSLEWFELDSRFSEDASWVVEGASLGIDGVEKSGGKVSAMMDSGTSNSFLDINTAQGILNEVPGFKIVTIPLPRNRTYDNYLVPCNTTGQTINFKLGPVTLNIPSADLPMPIINPQDFNPDDIVGMCSSTITFGASDPWLIGGLVIKYAYIGLEMAQNGTHLQSSRLGIAALK